MSRHVSCAALVALIGVGSFGCAADPWVEETGSSTKEIIGGAVDTAHPAVVAVLTDMADGSAGICTGTVIAPDVVLTAAHCVVPPNVGWHVLFGTSTSTPGAPVLPVKQAIAHPGFDRSTIGSANSRGQDVGVLVLSSPVTAVRPMPINRRALTPAMESMQLTFVGFGDDDGVNATGAGIKRTARASITEVRDEELSAGITGRTTCQGDSGGPWFGKVNGVETLLGTTSYGREGCTGAASATRVDRVLDFIEPFLTERAPAQDDPPIPGEPPPADDPPTPAPPPDEANGGPLAAGTTVNGSVAGAEVDRFTFTASSVRLRFETAGDAEIVVEGGGSRSVGRGSSSVSLGISPAATFTVSIRSPSGGAQSYTLSRE
jgi:hypothetical protein